jgi:thymidine kinase
MKNHINPGSFELYCGTMKSGKTREIINRVDRLKYVEGSIFKFIKPKIDTRDDTVISRFGSLSFRCSFVDENNPNEILDLIDDDLNLLIIDEIHFFSKEIYSVIEKILKDGKVHVIASGLDCDFRGEPFGQVPKLITLATKVVKLTSICDYPKCNEEALRPQRLINGEPANYNEPVHSIDKVESEYEARCLKHHQVPGKP